MVVWGLTVGSYTGLVMGLMWRRPRRMWRGYRGQAQLTVAQVRVAADSVRADCAPPVIAENRTELIRPRPSLGQNTPVIDSQSGRIQPDVGPRRGGEGVATATAATARHPRTPPLITNPGGSLEHEEAGTAAANQLMEQCAPCATAGLLCRA